MTSLAFFASAVAQNQNERAPAKGFAVFPAGDTCHTYEFARHAIGDNGIRIEILYAGICHSDLHAAWDEQKEQGLHAANRMIPRHEIAGCIAEVGKNVTKFNVGVQETQEMLDYSVAHGIYPEIEIIKADASEIDNAWRNLDGGKVKSRYVNDMGTIK